MNILGWLIIGALVGWVASKIWKKTSLGLLGYIIVGVLGSVVGGFLFGLLGINFSGAIGSFITSVIGAIVVLFLYSKMAK